MRHAARMRIQSLGDTDTGPGMVHAINVEYIDGSIHVSPDTLKIHSADSVCWEFIGVPDNWGRAIQFTQPLGMGPFAGGLLAGFNAMNVKTITGQNADDTPCKYKYNVVLTTPNNTRIELDPVIDNEGKPPGLMPEKPERPKGFDV